MYQIFLMSATLTGEVEELKGVVLKNPVVLKLEEDESELANLSQFCVRYVRSFSRSGQSGWN